MNIINNNLITVY